MLTGSQLAAGGAGAVGGGLLGALGSVLEPLDAPRQALANLFAGPASGNLMAALPGLGGAAIGGMLLANPVTAPFALPAGALAGGVSQYLSKLFAPEMYAAPTASEVAQNVGLGDSPILAALTGLVTDPLTYAGLGLGARLGSAARPAVAAERSAMTGVTEALPGAVAPRPAPVPVPPPALPAGPRFVVPNQADVTYSPEVLDMLPGLFDRANPARVYSRFDPAVGRQLDELAVGAFTRQGGLAMPFSPGAKGAYQPLIASGGYLKTTPGDVLPGHLFQTLEGVPVPNEALVMGADNVLDQYRALLAQATGLTGPRM